MKPCFSVAICSIDAQKFAHASECYDALLGGFPHEIIGIHDARSLAEGYNRALRRARGDIIIFSHDDILILDPDFGQKIARRLQDFDLLGFVGSRRIISECWWSAGLPWISGAMAHHHKRNINISIWNLEPWPVIDDIQAIDGLCMMARRETAQEIGFDETLFDGFHLYDLDFSFSAWRARKKLGVCCDIPVIHDSMGNFDKTFRKYGCLFAQKHRDALPTSPHIKDLEGKIAQFSNHRALLAAWQEDILRRAGATR